MGFPGLRLGLNQIGIGGKPAKHPGMPFRHHLAVDIALVDPERGEHPPILVEGAALDPHHAPPELLLQSSGRFGAIRLVEFGSIDSHQPNAMGLPLGVGAGDGVAIVNRPHQPLWPSGLIEALELTGLHSGRHGWNQQRQHQPPGTQVLRQPARWRRNPGAAGTRGNRRTRHERWQPEEGKTKPMPSGGV